jgi:nitrate/nitrite transporter NarK
MTIREDPAPLPVRQRPRRRHRCTAAALGLAGGGGIGTLMTTGIIHWGVAAILPATVAAVVAMATIVFSICTLLGIDPGPAGDHLRGVVRDVLRRPSP